MNKDFYIKDDFSTNDEAFEKAEAYRKSFNPDDLIYYTNDFLNDALTGITPGELVVIGADTGIGKSEFCIDLAFENSKRNKKVVLYSLEGGEHEVMHRLTWKLLSKEYFKNPDGRDWNFKKFLMNGIYVDDLMPKIKQEIESAEGLILFRNNKRLNRDLLKGIIGKTINADLIIIDHLHYFSLDESRNEFSQISELVSMIKEVTKILQVPIVLVSHLRKKDRFRFLPGVDDLHGSSNIGKEADTCIFITQDDIFDFSDEFRSNTFFIIGKSRSGASKKFIGMKTYLTNKKAYEVGYKLIKKKFDKDKRKMELVEIEPRNYPSWATYRSEYDIMTSKIGE